MRFLPCPVANRIRDPQARPALRASALGFLLAVCVLARLTDPVSAAVDAGFREPTLLGAWPGTPSGPALDVAVSASHAVVSTGDAGVWCYDFSTPASPRRIEVLGGLGAVRGVAISGTTALATAAPNGSETNGSPGGVFLIDLSNPSSVKIVGSLEHGWAGGPVAISGSHAFVADSPYGAPGTLRILDISNPASPRQIAEMAAEAVVMGLAIDGNRLYFVRQPWIIPGIPTTPISGGSLRIVDVSTPSNPVKLGDFAGTGTASGVSLFHHEAAVYACVANGTGVEIVDVTLAQAPRLVGTLTIPGADRVATASAGVVCATGDEGLTIIDVTNPSSPRSMVTWPIGRTCIALSIADQVAFLALGGGGWRAVSLQDPLHPTPVASQHTSRYTLRVAASGSRVYLADPNIGLEALDVTEPAAPRLIRDQDLSPPGLGSIATDGSRLCAGRGDHLLVYALDSSGSPLQVGDWQSPGTIDDIALSGDIAYLAAESAGLVIVSLHDPAAPRILGTARNGRVAWRLSVSGTQVNLTSFSTSGFENALEIIDAGDSSAPRTLATVPLNPYAGAVATVGDIVFTSEGGWTDAQDRWHPGILKVIDTSKPSSPVRIASLEVGGAISAMVPIDGRLYLCTRPAHFLANDPGAGLHVFDIRTPANPVRLGRYPVPGDDYSDLARAGDLLVVANAGNGCLLLGPHLSPLATLRFARTVGGIRLDWPASQIGAELQTTPGIPTATWQTLPGFTSTNVAVLPTDGGRGFFRLKRP